MTIKQDHGDQRGDSEAQDNVEKREDTRDVGIVWIRQDHGDQRVYPAKRKLRDGLQGGNRAEEAQQERLLIRLKSHGDNGAEEAQQERLRGTTGKHDGKHLSFAGQVVSKESREDRQFEMSSSQLQGLGMGGIEWRAMRGECEEDRVQLQLLSTEPCKGRGSIEQCKEEEVMRKRVRVEEESIFEAPNKLYPCKGRGSTEQCEDKEMMRKRARVEEEKGLKEGGCVGGDVGRGSGDWDADVDRNGGADVHDRADEHDRVYVHGCADKYGLLMEAWEKVGKRCCEMQMCAPMLSTQLALGLGNRGMRESAGEEMKVVEEVEEVEERVEREGRTTSPGRVERAKMSDDHQREMREWVRELGALWEVRARESAAVGIVRAAETARSVAVAAAADIAMTKTAPPAATAATTPTTSAAAANAAPAPAAADTAMNDASASTAAPSSADTATPAVAAAAAATTAGANVNPITDTPVPSAAAPFEATAGGMQRTLTFSSSCGSDANRSDYNKGLARSDQGRRDGEFGVAKKGLEGGGREGAEIGYFRRLGNQGSRDGEFGVAKKGLEGGGMEAAEACAAEAGFFRRLGNQGSRDGDFGGPKKGLVRGEKKEAAEACAAESEAAGGAADGAAAGAEAGAESGHEVSDESCVPVVPEQQMHVLTSSCSAERFQPVVHPLGRIEDTSYVDNKAMLALCREQRLEHRTKHIALRYFLARELQQRGQLRLAYVASEANTADVFTKALAPCDHQRCCTQLGLVPVLPHLLSS
ncbi:unnamed protein product [Closterium sp. NIES-54]